MFLPLQLVLPFQLVLTLHLFLLLQIVLLLQLFLPSSVPVVTNSILVIVVPAVTTSTAVTVVPVVTTSIVVTVVPAVTTSSPVKVVPGVTTSLPLQLLLPLHLFLQARLRCLCPEELCNDHTLPSTTGLLSSLQVHSSAGASAGAGYSSYLQVVSICAGVCLLLFGLLSVVCSIHQINNTR